MNIYFASGSISRALIESISFMNKKLPSKPTGIRNYIAMGKKYINLRTNKLIYIYI